VEFIKNTDLRSTAVKVMQRLVQVVLDCLVTYLCASCPR